MALETFKRIIESTQDELFAMQFSSELMLQEPLRAYARVTQLFLQGNKVALSDLVKEICSQASKKEDLRFLSVASELRLQLLELQIDADLLSRAQSLESESGYWSGELCMLIGSAYGHLREHEKELDWKRRAAESFTRIGAHKKAVRAMFNAIVAESYLYPDRSFINQYHSMYRQAMKRNSREVTVAGLCLLNISQDYQKIGALLVSVKFCDRAIKILNSDFGSLHYQLAVAHRCHVNLQLKRFAEAKIDYEMISKTEFPEIQGSLRLLEKTFKKESLAQLDEKEDLKLHRNWQERKQDWVRNGASGTSASFSKLEQRLISFLSEKKRERIEILEHLYGERLDLEVKSRRFQSLLCTLRKKAANLIIHEAGTYRLADALFRLEQQDCA